MTVEVPFLLMLCILRHLMNGDSLVISRMVLLFSLSLTCGDTEAFVLHEIHLKNSNGDV